jgi:hypothetical protein
MHLSFEVLTAANTITDVLLDAAQCNLVEFYRRFGGICCLHYQYGSKHLWRVCKLLPDYMAQQLKREYFQNKLIFNNFLFFSRIIF